MNTCESIAARAARVVGRLLFVAFACSATLAHAVLPIEQWTTSHGVKVLFVQADGIPMLDIAVRFDAGDRLDPPEKIGLADMTASLLDAGAGDLDEAGIADAFALLGSRRSSWSGMDSATAELRTLTSEPELRESLKLFSDMIVRPKFSDAVVQREKERAVQGFRESLKRPGTLMRREYVRLLYRDHPYGALPSAEAFEAIEPADLRDFHREHYVHARASIAMIGAVNRKQAEAIAEQLLDGLPQGSAGNQLTPLQPVQAAETQIPHPATQSHIVVGTPFIARGDPDYFALLVGNHVLGGGSFVSRLYKQVREERGLAYSVSSGFSLRTQPGPFSISLQTRREKTAEALELVREVLNKFVAEGPTEEEVEAAKSNLAGGFALRIDSNGKILGLLSAIGYHGLPLNYLETWPGKIRAVTREQVIDAVKRRIKPEEMVTVVVGESAVPE